MGGDSDSESKYLSEGFDASTLKVSSLRNILVKHSVDYPSNAKKGELLSIVQKKVLSKASKLRKEAKKLKKIKADGRDIEVVDSEPSIGARTRARNAPSSSAAETGGEAGEETNTESKAESKNKKPSASALAKAKAKSKPKHKHKESSAEPEPEPELELERVVGAKRKLSEAEGEDKPAEEKTKQHGLGAGNDQKGADAQKQRIAKRRVLHPHHQQQQQLKKREASSVAASGLGSSDSEYSSRNTTNNDDQQQRKRMAAAGKAGTLLRSPAKARETGGNFSDDNPFQGSNSPETPRKRRRQSSTVVGNTTPLSALRKSQVSDVTFRVALPVAAEKEMETGAEAEDVEMAGGSGESGEEEVSSGEMIVEPPQLQNVSVGDLVAKYQGQAQAQAQVQDQSRAQSQIRSPLIRSPSPAASKLSRKHGAPSLTPSAAPPKFDLAVSPESAPAYQSAFHSPSRFTMTPDALRQMSLGSPPEAVRRRTVASGLPPVSPSVAASDDIHSLQRRRVATLRQHAESPKQLHSRRSSVASIADSIGEARGIPAIPATAAAAAEPVQPVRRSSLARRVVVCALISIAALGWRTHTQFGIGFGSTRADALPLQPPTDSILTPPQPIDTLSAPLSERARYVAQLVRAAYLAPPPLQCPEHASCAPFVAIDAQRAVADASGAQWLAPHADGSASGMRTVMTCDAGHVLRFPPVPRLALRLLPAVPECVRDVSTENRVRQLADAMVQLCSERRGSAQCAQSLYEQARELMRQPPADAEHDEADEADEVERLGVSVPELRRALAARKAPRLADAQFDALFQRAVDELTNARGDAVTPVVLEFEADADADDADAEAGAEVTYFVARRAQLPPLCRARRLALALVLGNVRRLLSAVGLGVVALVASRRLAAHRAEVRAADALVVSALLRLKRQARRHYLDPALSP
ncbi:inner nuclear membrane protein enriched at telomere/subtelomere region, partial [Kickxella alabastrina]